jgi:hypothetical protein
MARNFDVFKVVEINNSTALRIGHVVAQQPLDKAAIEASGKVVPVSKDGYLDNGFFLKLDNDGAVVVPVDGNATSPAYLVFNDPILDLREDYGLLSDFAEKFDDDDLMYPRLVALYPGDVFTTDNYAGNVPAAGTPGLAYVNFATGVLTIGSLPEDYVGPKFSVLRSTLPDGETLALEVLVVAVV